MQRFFLWLSPRVQNSSVWTKGEGSNTDRKMQRKKRLDGRESGRNAWQVLQTVFSVMKTRKTLQIREKIKWPCVVLHPVTLFRHFPISHMTVWLLHNRL